MEDSTQFVKLLEMELEHKSRKEKQKKRPKREKTHYVSCHDMRAGKKSRGGGKIGQAKT